ncbi:MAG: FG-GAP repeat protein [Bythopirellula sp.]
MTANLLHTFNDPTVTNQDHFGRSVALDGNKVLIAATGDDTNGTGVGQAYLFTVPEPSSCLIVLIGGSGIVVIDRRRRRFSR